MPYRVLTAILAVSSVAAIVLALAPSTEDAVRSLDAVTAVVLAAAAVALWFFGDRLADGLALDLGAMLGALVAWFGALTVPTGRGQVLIGLGLVLFGVFLAYFRSPRRTALLLAVMLSGYVAATLVNRRIDTFVDVVLICLVTGSVTIMVSRLATELRSLALRDSLTGALNRRGLDLVAGPVAASAVRAGLPITVGLIDIDPFKAYNDEHGHLAGDAALRRGRRCLDRAPARRRRPRALRGRRVRPRPAGHPTRGRRAARRRSWRRRTRCAGLPGSSSGRRRRISTPPSAARTTSCTSVSPSAAERPEAGAASSRCRDCPRMPAGSRRPARVSC